MQSIDTPIQQAEAGWFARREAQGYLEVGKNAVAAIADRFCLVSVDGCFEERDVWQKILENLQPMHDHGADLLRIPLRDIHWVAGQTRQGVINDPERDRTWDLPIQLRGPTWRARRRRRSASSRWCAPVFDAERRGTALAAVRKASSPIVVKDVFGLPPLDDFPGSEPCRNHHDDPPSGSGCNGIS